MWFQGNYRGVLPFQVQKCQNSSRCLKALDALIDAWQEVCNAIHVPLTKDLGTLIANFNFLLETYQGFQYHRNHEIYFPFSQKKMKSLHGQITKMISNSFSNFILRDKNIMFIDLMGLLGFETNFGSQQWTGKNYQKISSILYPQFGFDKCNNNHKSSFQSCFDKEKMTVNQTNVCELSMVYCEWVYYICHIEEMANEKKS